MKLSVEKLKFALLFVFLVFIASANAQTPNPETIVVDNSSHYAAYRADDKNVIFVFEIIDDFTDNTDGYYPRVDFVSFTVDVNQNAEIDKYIDASYGIVGKEFLRSVNERPGICTGFLVSDISKTGCGLFKSKASLDYGFRSSNKETRPHPVYEFKIPKKELSKDGTSAQIRLTFYSYERGYEIYPKKEPGEVYNSLLKTLRINF